LVKNIIALALVVLTLLLPGCSSLFFYPDKEMYENPFVRPFSPEDVSFKTADGITLFGWFFRAHDAAGSVLFLHGNAGNISTHVNGVLWFVKAGFNLFIFDYRGYGRSGGEPSPGGVVLDAEAALEALLAMPSVDKDRIVVFGQSIGGAIAIDLVAMAPHRAQVRALVVDSAFASYREIAREKMDMLWLTWPFQYPLSWAFSDRYSPLLFISRVSPIPVLFIHGMNDPVVPVHHGEELYDAAGEPKEIWLTGGEGHIRSTVDPAVRGLLKAYLLTRLTGT
jgi:fermentation-respiration switch protein FrsA (DUF1100 family)